MPPSTSVHIRPAKERDAEAISRLHDVIAHPIDADGARDRIAAFTRAANHCYLVAERQGEVIGFATASTVESPLTPRRCGIISAVAVATPHQRKRVGTMLLAALEDWFRSQGCVCVRVTSSFHRTETAHRFYPAVGYRQTGLRFDKDL